MDDDLHSPQPCKTYQIRDQAGRPHSRSLPFKPHHKDYQDTLLGFDPVKVNPNGDAVALGHPIGASGAIIAIKTLYELHRIGGRYAL